VPYFTVVGGEDEEFEQAGTKRRLRNPYHPSPSEIDIAKGVLESLISAGILKLVPWTVARLRSKLKAGKKKSAKKKLAKKKIKKADPPHTVRIIN